MRITDLREMVAELEAVLEDYGFQARWAALGVILSRLIAAQPIPERERILQALVKGIRDSCKEICWARIPGTNNLCTRRSGHEGEHRCAASDVDARRRQ